jgi:hypothetical protein
VVVRISFDSFSSRVCAVCLSPLMIYSPLLFDLPPLGIFSRAQIWSSSFPAGQLFSVSSFSPPPVVSVASSSFRFPAGLHRSGFGLLRV